jgi:hypothetical protein
MMCIGTSVHADIRVSVQDRSAPDRASGHIATAVLVDGDAVLVPNPPARLLDPSADLEIVIFTADPEAHSPIEVIPVWKWSPFHLTAAKEPTAAIARLRHHSVYGAQIGPLDNRELAAAIADNGGDLWAALATVSAIPDGIATIDPTVLGDLTRREREQRQPRRSEHAFDTYEQMVDGFCIFFCFCSPHGPK